MIKFFHVFAYLLIFFLLKILNTYQLSKFDQINVYYSFSTPTRYLKLINVTQEFLKNKKIKCKTCNFVPYKGKSIPNSSEKDAILTFATNKLDNLLPFIRSLRTTGSRCRVILFVNGKLLKTYPRLYFESAASCGVEFLDFGSLSFSKLQAYFIRYCFFKQFLKENKDKIKRVIFVDLYDTIFQHDPFTTDFGNRLYLTPEDRQFNISKINLVWLMDCVKYFKKFYDPTLSDLFTEEFKKEVLKKNVINGGAQGGPIDIMIEYSESMLKMGNQQTFEVKLNDQSFLNALTYSGFFDNKFDYTILNLKSELFQSIHTYCFTHINKDPKKYEIGKVGRYGSVPAILHQYDRSKKLRNLTLEVCPNENNFKDYVRNW